MIFMSKYTYDKSYIIVNELANVISIYCFFGYHLTTNYVVEDQPEQYNRFNCNEC